MGKIVYLVRHGETVFNVQKKMQGWCDSPLTTKGIQQAQRTKLYFDTLSIDHAYSSTSERCCDTIEIILANRLSYQRHKGLKEMHYGRFEGESEALKPKRWEDFSDFFVSYGGESRKEVEMRMVATLTEIMEREDHHNVLVVSHSGACYNFLSHWQDPMQELEKGFTNGCICKYAYANHKFKLLEVIR